jgi:hypothetical protein
MKRRGEPGAEITADERRPSRARSGRASDFGPAPGDHLQPGLLDEAGAAEALQPLLVETVLVVERFRLPCALHEGSGFLAQLVNGVEWHAASLARRRHSGKRHRFGFEVISTRSDGAAAWCKPAMREIRAHWDWQLLLIMQG